MNSAVLLLTAKEQPRGPSQFACSVRILLETPIAPAAMKAPDEHREEHPPAGSCWLREQISAGIRQWACELTVLETLIRGHYLLSTIQLDGKRMVRMAGNV